MDLSPQHFFELAEFNHASLFEGVHHVWECLAAIKPYLKRYPLGKIACEIPEGAWLVNPELITIGSGTVVEPGAYIKGPCIIGSHCTIRHGAYIRGNVIVGDRCVIGHATEVKESIFLNEAHAAHFAYVGDSVLGNGVNLGAGTKLANLKIDQTQVFVKVGGEFFATGLRKFGAVLGDRVQLGCNSVTNPGTLMAPGSSCYPCINVSGYVPPKICISNQQPLRQRKF